MTTERRRPTRAARSGGRDLRPWLVALLAAVYLVGWWAFATPAARPTVPSAEVAPKEAPSGPATVAIWYTELPRTDRPSVVLPPGWRIAEAPDAGRSAARQAVPTPVRVVSHARRGRIRTRSS